MPELLITLLVGAIIGVSWALRWFASRILEIRGHTDAARAMLSMRFRTYLMPLVLFAGLVIVVVSRMI